MVVDTGCEASKHTALLTFWGGGKGGKEAE